MISFAKSHHLPAINEIYNQAVDDGSRTAHTKPIALKERKFWFKKHSQEQYPVFIYEDEDNVLGWLSISPYRSDRQALNEIIEISYYVHYDYHRNGIATKLMQQALTFCEDTSYRIIVAILISENKPSIQLLKKFAFEDGGRIPNAIHYKDEFHDHLYMYKELSN